ncbi:leucine-rich repeat protein [Alkaliphilus peptidifermentans]|uniref:Fibronectin type III domain-containing protein n=1 Tax=Alkaliphilus peptidifermentans DSM 18978 TaxID=1120976 RepID=A0A1G5IMF3_9FIRM|nr:leucine-rich repeat protein [Alkaliphilus peptidifermentans]SCY77315.1 Fibronectin type III domain-containing protein [Alkaliphilus peptidifermentans DSM 18978]
MKSMRLKVGVIILRILIIALIVIVIPGYHGLKVHAEQDEATGLIYTVTDDKVTITGFVTPDGFDGILDIPAAIDGKSVVSIGQGAFRECSLLVHVTIPDSVTTIGKEAFEKCENLISITIPDSVTSIGEYAFFRCSALQSITIPDNVTSIGQGAFSFCVALKNATLPTDLVSIENQLFYNCIKLQSITIPDKVESIGVQAFASCSALENVTIGASVKSIDKRAFSSCTSMKSVIIPDSCEIIGNGAFANCTSLESVIIGNGVKTIGEDGFSNCSVLESIIIPDSVTSIESSAFSYCHKLKSITIGKAVESIGAFTFSICSALESITIPHSVTSIGAYAFSNCSALQRIIIPDSVTNMGNDVFWASPEISIYCYQDSYAYNYANANNIAFNILPNATIIPDIAIFDKNPSRQTDISTEIICKNPAALLSDIKVSDTSIGTGHYSIKGNILTIKKEYLAAKDLGDLELTLEFDTGDEAVLTISIIETIPISWPSGSTMTASGTTSTRTMLSWTQAQDDLGVAGYRIYMDGTIRTNVEGTVLSSEITGLEPSTTYSFRIQAGDGDGNWTTDGPEVTVTTLASESPDNGGGPITDEEKVAVDKSVLSIGFAVGDSANSVTEDISLTRIGAGYGSDISWTSNNENIIKISTGGDIGLVTRPTSGSGDAHVTVTAAVYNNGANGTRDFNLIVLQLQPPASQKVTISITKTDVTTGGNNGSITITAYGGSGTYEYSNDNGSTWQDSNIFRGLTAGTYRVKARDSIDPGNISEVSTVTITSSGGSSDGDSGGGSSGGGASGGSSIPNLKITDKTPEKSNIGESYSFRITVTGGSGGYSFEVTSGTLPEGLTLSKDGVISGIPTKAGTYQYTITVTDKNGRVSKESFTQIIEEKTEAIQQAEPTEEPKKEQETITPKVHILLTIGESQIKIDDEAYLLDAIPFIDGASNRTLVPIRFISEALGAEVIWLPETRQVLIKDGEKEILLTIGSKEVLVNGEAIIIDCEAAILPPGRTYAPLRFICEALGATVEYDPETREISIIK